MGTLHHANINENRIHIEKNNSSHHGKESTSTKTCILPWHRPSVGQDERNYQWLLLLQQVGENAECRLGKLRGLHSSLISLVFFFFFFFQPLLFLCLVPTNWEPGTGYTDTYCPSSFQVSLHVLWMFAVRALCGCLFCLFFRHQKKVPQVLLRWSIQKNYITIPKTSRKERILENADIFDFTLSVEDMKILVSIKRFILFPWHEWILWSWKLTT